jgi:hypothetical protein
VSTPSLPKSVSLGLILFAAAAASGGDGKENPEVRVSVNEAARRVDVFAGKEPFTSYIYPERLKKPVLYPLRTPKGTLVTRGFPLDPRPGERVDHPHHVGLWMNYGDVSGVDFWNNSDTLPAGQQAKMGTIVHRGVTHTAGGKGKGELDVSADWIMPDGKPAVTEKTRFIFRAEPDVRIIDRITTLTAGDKRVTFTDNKEGVIGMRVRRELEHPADKPEVFTDASGKPTAVPVLDNKGVTGMYRSSEGKTGEGVWGTRGRWMSLTGTVGDETITVEMIDHPKNPGYPTYWHARGYGLFAANPLGQKALSNGKDELNFALEAKQSAVFRYRIVLRSRATTAEESEADYKRFVTEVQ